MMLTNTFLSLLSRLRNKIRFTHLQYLLCLFIAWPFIIEAKDVLKLNDNPLSQKMSSLYNIEVLHKAMQITEPEFGEYDLQFVTKDVPGLRLLKIINEGNAVNVTVKVSTPEWEEEAVPIRIPLRRGMLNYRLLLINKNTLKEFSTIKNIKQLKTKTVGLRRHWATWQTMTNLGYTVTNAFSNDAIFGMLSLERFDYVPRGIHEIYEEINIRQDKLKNLAVEPNLALYIPAPFYVFVSPKEPRLIRRLELGLNRLAKQGILEDMVNKYYGEFLQRADLKNRLILNVGNPDLPPKTPIANKELWLNWD